MLDGYGPGGWRWGELFLVDLVSECLSPGI